MEVKYVGGKDPEMLFYNDNGEVVKVRQTMCPGCISQSQVLRGELTARHRLTDFRDMIP